MPPEERTESPGLENPDALEEIHERVRALGQESERIISDLVSGESRFRKLAKAVWQVQEEERRRLARELHDGIGQTLAALKNHLEWMKPSASAGNESSLGEAVDLASQALEDTRELSRLLRPPVLDDLGLTPALRWLGRTMGKRFGIEVTIEADELEQRSAAEIETVLFRIAQEALTNAAKHARASEVLIELRKNENGLVLSITDDGAGFDVAEAARTNDQTGVGLRGMQDRVELFEGSLSIGSELGTGTRIEAQVPLGTRSEP